MEVDKNEWKVLHRALQEWEQQKLLTPEQVKQLKSEISLKRSERQLIAQYLFIIALSCTLLAFGAIFIDDKLLEKIKAYFSISNLAIAAVTAIISVSWFWYVQKRKQRLSSVSYEICMILGSLSSLTSLVYVCKELGSGASYSTFAFIASLLLFILSAAFRSRSLWVVALIGITIWFGIFSTIESTHNLYMGMNYAVRLAAFGGAILLLSALQKRTGLLSYAGTLSYIMGMLLFFLGLWTVSIFGNYDTIDQWAKVRQSHELPYVLLFGGAAIASLYYGIRYHDDTARDFGLLFLLINLYTRYFEYFWDTMNKGIFFLILAVTFGIIGRWIEKNKKFSKLKFPKQHLR